MSCRDIHATNAFAFIIAFVSVAGLAVAALVPQWRVTRLVTFNRNAKNIGVYDGLWTKCVKQDGYSGCYYYDAEVRLSGPVRSLFYAVLKFGMDEYRYQPYFSVSGTRGGSDTSHQYLRKRTSDIEFFGSSWC